MISTVRFTSRTAFLFIRSAPAAATRLCMFLQGSSQVGEGDLCTLATWARAWVIRKSVWRMQISIYACEWYSW